MNAGDASVAQKLWYDVFGQVSFDSNPGFQPFGYAGGLYDPDTGLVRFGARDYDPHIGRWTAPDPIGFSGGQENLYAYVENFPTGWSDPSGRFLVPVLIGGAIGAVGNTLVYHYSQKRRSREGCRCNRRWSRPGRR